MTASVTIPPIDQAHPGIQTRVAEGGLAGSQRMLLGAGVVAVGVSLVQLFMGTEDVSGAQQWLFSYLAAYMFVLSLALGSLFFVMLQHVARAGWSVVVRRVAENMSSVMPAMAILFLPIAVGYHTLWHHWIDAPADDLVVQGKSGYLNVPFFFVRAVIYFVIWIALARYFRNASLKQDETGDASVSLKLSQRAAPCIALFALSITFAAFDWLMSLDPHWFSTIFGVYYFGGAVMATLCVIALLCMWLGKHGYLKDAVTTEHYHDLGKLFFAFMVFWTYVAFSQFMLINYANLPEETLWYQHRSEGSWQAVSYFLAIGHFGVPFVFLMSRHIKRNRKLLALGAVFLVFMHMVDMHWLVLPTIHHHGIHPTLADFALWIGLLAIYLGLVLGAIRKVPLIPTRDPRLTESLKFQNH